MRTVPNAPERVRPRSRGQLLTVLEVADRLRCSRTTVFGLIRSGELPSVMPGRTRLVDLVDVDAYLERERIAAR